MSRPTPESFDTLEKAQAEIARCYERMDRLAAFADEVVKATERAQAEIDRVMGSER